MLLNENLFEKYDWNPDDASNDMIDMESDKPENQNINLEEDFSSSLPDWIIKNRTIINLLSKHNIDLNKVKFIETSPPTSGWDPTIKNTNLLKVYRLKSDSKYPSYEVYIPGYNDDLHFDLEGGFRYKSITSYSTKQLLAHTVNFGYIDLSDASNTNYQIKKDRFNAKKDDLNIDRDKFKQFSHIPKLGYEKDPDGSTDYASPIYGDLEWLTKSGYDKSGYKLNPNKYKDLLIKLKAENIQESLEEYYNKIESLRASIIDKISSIDMKTESGRRAMDKMTSLINRLSSALYEYQDVSHELASVQRGVEAGRWEEDEAKSWIQSAIKSAFKSIDKDLEYSKDYFNEIDRLLAKDLENSNSGNNNMIEESITPDINSAELQKLAKKHNVDILSPMSNGDLRLSGAGADLMKFYQEAQEKGLWEVDPILYEKLDLTGMPDGSQIELFVKDIHDHFEGKYNIDLIDGYKIHIKDITDDLSDKIKEAKYIKANNIEIDTQRMKDGSYVYLLKFAKNIDEALYGKGQIDLFLNMARDLKVLTLSQLKYVLDQGRKQGKSDFETMLDLSLEYNDKLPDNLIKGLTKEFLDLCWDIGIVTQEDYDRFVAEEVQEGETETQALKRYIQELKDDGFPFDKIRAESEKAWKERQVITEGVMSEIDLELKSFDNNKENYIADLKLQLDQLKDTIESLEYALDNAGKPGYNYDSSDIKELQQDLEDTNKKFNETKKKLNYIQG